MLKIKNQVFDLIHVVIIFIEIRVCNMSVFLQNKIKPISITWFVRILLSVN